MALKAGSINDFDNSMAKAIEDAFLEEWPLAMGEQPTPEMNNQMRLLFVAVAKGVVRYLDAHESSFKFTYLHYDHTHTSNIEIDVEP